MGSLCFVVVVVTYLHTVEHKMKMKMKSEINYHERSHYYSTKYMRSSKAVGVLWGIFTLCYTILAIVVFMQDQWIGDADNSKGPGNFGTWRWCTDRLVKYQVHRLSSSLVCYSLDFESWYFFF